MALRTFFSRKTPVALPRTIAEGERLYAIGDIHGRRDCLDQLLLQIGEDDRDRGPAQTTRRRRQSSDSSGSGQKREAPQTWGQDRGRPLQAALTPLAPGRPHAPNKELPVVA
jgi:hypothetical protein